MKARVQMAALDLDGTLLGEDLSVSAPVRRALARAQGRGVTIVLATGRAYPSARDFQASLGLTGPIVCYQGAVARGPTGDLWLHTGLPRGVAAAAAEYASARGDHVTFYASDVVLLRSLARTGEFYDRWFGLPRRILKSWRDLPPSPTKLLVVARDADHGHGVEAAWKSRFEGQMAVVRSHDLFVEGVAPGVSKGAALAVVAGHLGVHRSRVMAVGDNDNDASMLAWAGIGVAMGGAPAAVADQADALAPGVADHGAAWALERYAGAGE